MKILLINNNPVVSRLTALSARKEEIEIDEIQEVTELSSDIYDIVFVDADSWTKDVRDVISENIKMQKSVLFYSDGDEEEKDSFDIAILKPFLPSEVSAVIRSVQEHLPSEALEGEEHFDFIEEGKSLEKDEVFDLGLDKEEDKFTAVDDNLAEVDSKVSSFDEKLAEAFPTKESSLDDELLEDTKIELDFDNDEELKLEKKSEIHKKDEDELFELNLNDEIPSLEDDLFSDDKEEKKETEKEESKKEESKKVVDTDTFEDFELEDLVLEPTSKQADEVENVLDDEPLELDTLEEKEIEAKPEVETAQVLDIDEIEKIKGILSEDTSNEVSLEDLSTITEKEAITEEKVKELDAEPLKIDSDTLAHTLTAMPVEALRELLAGAKVHIKIKFPKSKK